jgi:hypothetical protein
MARQPFAHEFDELLCFFGGNPLDIREFGGEIELYLGDEHEKHIINNTCVVYIPKGLPHGPINFKRIDKPIMFAHVSLTSRYTNAIVPPPPDD